MSEEVNFLRKLRLDRMLSTKELSDLSGVSVMEILNIEKGQYKPGPIIIKKLAEALAYNYEELYKKLRNEE